MIEAQWNRAFLVPAFDRQIRSPSVPLSRNLIHQWPALVYPVDRHEVAPSNG